MSNNCQPAPNGNLFICNILIYNKKISGLEIANYSAFRKGTGVPFAIKQAKQDTLTNRLERESSSLGRCFADAVRATSLGC